MEIAVNAPPMHSNCRCSISAYFSENEFEGWLDFLDKEMSEEKWEQLKKSKKPADKQLKELENHLNGTLAKSSESSTILFLTVEKIKTSRKSSVYAGCEVFCSRFEVWYFIFFLYFFSELFSSGFL